MYVCGVEGTRGRKAGRKLGRVSRTLTLTLKKQGEKEGITQVLTGALCWAEWTDYRITINSSHTSDGETEVQGVSLELDSSVYDLWVFLGLWPVIALCSHLPIDHLRGLSLRGKGLKGEGTQRRGHPPLGNSVAGTSIMMTTVLPTGSRLLSTVKIRYKTGECERDTQSPVRP